MAIVLVDARNVLRSVWPNIPEAELVDRCRRWAELGRHQAVVVFDGTAPPSGDDGVEVVGTGRESADDWIARRAAEPAQAEIWVVTSDRELRGRVPAASRLVGGGSFARELLLLAM
jgi:predicted RNA-binding protein with PIN domain